MSIVIIFAKPRSVDTDDANITGSNDLIEGERTSFALDPARVNRSCIFVGVITKPNRKLFPCLLSICSWIKNVLRLGEDIIT